MNNDTAFAALYFDDSVAEISLTSQGRNKTDRIPLVNEDVVLSEERKGEQYFHDAELCFQHWQSCISCHPEARVDGLNWDLMNDGIGNPKNTRSMLLSHATPPVMSLGVRDKAETAVRAGIRYIQFAIRPDEDAQAIDSYLKALKPVASPYLQEGALTESAQRGKELFHNQGGCAHCHPAPLYTDLKLHELGLTQGLDEGKAVDTPTLVEIWRTAPYLHDGRAATLHEVLKQYNADDRHGKTKDLDEEALDDLVAFLLSL
ncbi:MAG: c-type cytochrome [Candidatus Hydrogenedentes bacterium]|nr:c-type cytochrome [Candidatus Hydrogenedentota bacterium]